jgi:hypothetical protein
MDGLTKELDAYFKALGDMKIGELSIEAITEQVDKESQALFNSLDDNTPEDTGGLKRSLKTAKISNVRWYGYETLYDGIAPSGEPYEKIANILNYGSPTIRPRRFITRAVRQLRGMDERIYDRYLKKIDEAFAQEVK